MKRTISMLGIYLMVILISGSFAIKPEWNSYGWLQLNAETGRGQMNTGYWAVVVGAETWLTKYWWNISGYCFNNDDYHYWAWLPGYGYTQVTAEKLAMTIKNDSNLGLGAMPYDALYAIEDALQKDHDNDELEKPQNFQWDPISAWKWRSVYMEGRYADNGDPTRINANCWGTADYLTRSYKWVEGYSYYKDLAMDFGVPETGASFPFIYLSGYTTDEYPEQPYSIDDDLVNPSSYFSLKGTGNISGGLKNIINSFDIIRMGYAPQGTPDGYELEWKDGTNLGKNRHCAAYLCTDNSGYAWFYQKGNGGATSDAPYGIHAFGLDPDWEYEDAWRCYFHHNDYYKGNYASSYETDWAGVE